MSSSEHILAVDVGSSSVRCSLYNARGDLVERGGEGFRYGFVATRDGGSTMDTDELCDQIFAALDEIHIRIQERAGSVAGVGLTTFWHSVLGLDQLGHPTT